MTHERSKTAIFEWARLNTNSLKNQDGAHNLFRCHHNSEPIFFVAPVHPTYFKNKTLEVREK